MQRTTKNEKEIMQYLGISNKEDFEKDLIKLALLLEEKYFDEISKGKYGYGLSCDFYSTPFMLEDEYELELIEEIDGIVVYEKIPL